MHYIRTIEDNNTIVNGVGRRKILNEENLKWVLENTAGWANFLACLKAYLEYGIQLRVGAYDFMRKK